MGGTCWSDAHYRSRAEHLRTRGRSAFGYDEDIRAGSVAAGVHEKMDPARLKGGRRESRDSDKHPVVNDTTRDGILARLNDVAPVMITADGPTHFDRTASACAKFLHSSPQTAAGAETARFSNPGTCPSFDCATSRLYHRPRNNFLV